MAETTTRLTWEEWWDRWDALAERFHTAYSEGATGAVLSRVVRDQQALLTKIPRTGRSQVEPHDDPPLTPRQRRLRSGSMADPDDLMTPRTASARRTTAARDEVADPDEHGYHGDGTSACALCGQPMNAHASEYRKS